MKRYLIGVVAVLASGSLLLSSTAIAQQALVIKALTEKKAAELPAGPLFWRLENFPTLAQAHAAAGPMGLAAESGGRVWLVTLGPAGGSSAGGT
ncbi:MAG: cupin domain-containing protein, partial [bacterium]